VVTGRSPKASWDEGEPFEQGALREVFEENRDQVQFTRFVGTTTTPTDRQAQDRGLLLMSAGRPILSELR